MIQIEEINKLVAEKIAETAMFLVELRVTPTSHIHVLVDSPSGVTIAECVSLSRHIEHALDREANDFSLEVSSPGLDQPFKVFQQYQKSIGKLVDVRTKDGMVHVEVMQEVTPEHIVLSQKELLKIEGGKKKEWVEKQNRIPFVDIHETKIEIVFN